MAREQLSPNPNPNPNSNPTTGLTPCPDIDVLKHFHDSSGTSDVMDDDYDGGGGCRSGGKRKGLSSKNLVSERRRRKRLNQRLYSLRAIVPNISKVHHTCIHLHAHTIHMLSHTHTYKCVHLACIIYTEILLVLHYICIHTHVFIYLHSSCIHACILTYMG